MMAAKLRCDAVVGLRDCFHRCAQYILIMGVVFQCPMNYCIEDTCQNIGLSTLPATFREFFLFSLPGLSMGERRYNMPEALKQK
jgi:Sec-independent protein secretion pathway component TatC